MRSSTRLLAASALALAVAFAALPTGSAQVGKPLTVADANAVPESELAGYPNMTAAIARALVAERPFASIKDLNAFLLSQGLTQAQATEFYGKAFVHINLNTATPEEILLVPSAGKRMVHEFDEYRPWKTYAQFDKEIGKYVGAEATAKLAQYTFIPIDANTASDDVLLTVPGANAALIQKIKAGRPYKTTTDLETALSKGTSPAEGKRVARFFIVQP
jgi:DNA uptake protein ComE-like DNA-binding protein